MSDASVIGKIMIAGELVLDSALLIGDGAGENPDNKRDIHVLKNRGGKPFVPGTSICGVLREYFARTEPAAVEKIFGDLDSMQSSIQIGDVELIDGAIIFRDGVSIDGSTGVGINGGKYDYEAVERGAHGAIKMLVTLRACHERDAIKNSISRLLKRLELGIEVGALTAKGFGRVHVENLIADFYDFRNKSDVAAWLMNYPASEKILPSDDIQSGGDDLIIDADFVMNSSLIVRNYDTREKIGENKIHAVSLKSRDDFLIPGTTLKGILRHRAEYILSRLGCPNAALDDLMGISNKALKIKSRFVVDEIYISTENVRAAVHSRTRVDRFTGGALQGTLFTMKPIWQSTTKPSLKIHFEIRKVKRDAEVGLALALLRDLWTGLIAIGGEKSVGRGTLSGRGAWISFDGRHYELDRDGKIIFGDADEFKRLARTLKNFSEGAD